MSLTQTLAYDTPSNFVYDATKIDVTTAAALKIGPNTGRTFSQDFAAATGFTYDSTKAEFVGGVLRQKAQRPTGGTFGARFDSFVNANWGDGVLTAGVNGAAAVSGGKLDLTGSSGKFVTFAAAGNAAPLGNVGTVRFRFTPNYNGAPADSQIFFDLYNSSDSAKSRITLFHHANGAFFIVISDSDGNLIVDSSVAPYSATLGTEIELELGWDFNAAKAYFYGEGFLVTTFDLTGIRDTNADTIQIGDANSNFSIRDLILFNAVEHTASTYPAHVYTVPAGDYVESAASLPAFAYSGPGSLQAFTDFAATVGGSPRFTVAGKYWNGSAWATSDGTYAEASAAATIALHIATLPAANSLAVAAVFPDGNTRASVDLLTVTYTGQIYPTDDPAIINASGVGADALNDFSATVSASGSDGVRFQVQVSGSNKYWNGSAWAASDGTYAQANSAATIAANAASLDIAAGATIKVRALLHSADGSTSPTLTGAVVTYDFFAPLPTAPTECIVYGFVRDILGDVEAATLIVTLAEQFEWGGTHVVVPSVKRVTADADGRFEISLIETASVSKKYKFEVRYTNDAGKTQTVRLGDATVPNSPSVNLATLTFS